jgi:hypothetical protein
MNIGSESSRNLTSGISFSRMLLITYGTGQWPNVVQTFFKGGSGAFQEQFKGCLFVGYTRSMRF